MPIAKVNEAFAIGNLDGNHTALGVACTIKTVEQDTGIYIDHFVVVNFDGFKDMVAALGGVEECNPTPIDDPLSHLYLSAGYHMLTPAQALGYVRARYTLGDGSDLQQETVAAGLSVGSPHRVAGHSAGAAGTTASPAASAGGTGTPASLQARTANQNICDG